MDGVAVGFGMAFFVIVVSVLTVAGLVFWIIALVEVARTPDHAYRAVGTEKTTWLLVVGLAGWIGGLIYWFGTRQQLARTGAIGPGVAGGAYGAPHGGPHQPVAPYQPATPPGWYQNPVADGLRWWDGRQWTDHVS